MTTTTYSICTDNLQLIALSPIDTFIFMLDGIQQVVIFKYVWCCFV